MQRLTPKLKAFSRSLRHEMTDTEQHLWRYLRMRQVAGYRFRRQHPTCGYILDFACIELKLAIELDGGQHADNIVVDEIRSKALNHAGWKMHRFWNNDVLANTEAVLSEIHRLIGEIQPPS
jgi:very-short-patch-repair endonuclease